MKRLLLATLLLAACATNRLTPEERREAFIRASPDMSPGRADTIRKGDLTIGMSATEVLASIGRPTEVNKSVGSWGVHEQWVYGFSVYSRFYVYIENGKLTSVQGDDVRVRYIRDGDG